MKNIFRTLWLTLLLCSFHLNAQKTDPIFLPPLSNETPEFFNFFYASDFPANVNVNQTDLAAIKYAGTLKHTAHEEEIKTGEEQEDVYLLFYKRWRRSVENYIQPNGTVVIPKEEVQHQQKSLKLQNPTAASWSLVGPVETYWTYDSKPLQPQCAWQLNMYTCVIAPSNASVLYASGETGGVYKTVDKGLNWSMVLDITQAITAIAIDPTNPSVVYAGRSNAIRKTTDGGATWTTATPSCGNVNGLAVHPTVTNTVYAATANGLYKSTNGGTTWAITGGINTAVYDVWMKTNDPNTVFILKKSGGPIEFWKSTDGGNTFAKSMNGWTPVNSNAARMTVTTADANRLYVVVLGAAPDSTAPYIFRSNDAGQNWTKMCMGITSGLGGNATLPLGMSNGQGYYDLAILASPNNADHVLVGTTTAYKSVDGGQTFNRFGGYGGNFEIHPDIQWMVANGNDTWIATDGGLNYSTDFFTNTANFTTRNKGLFGSAFWGFTQGWNEDIVAGGRYHNGNTVISESYPHSKALRLGGGESATGHYMIGRPRHIAFNDINDVVVPSAFNGSSSNFSYNKYPNNDGYGSDASDVEFMPYTYNTIFTGEGNELWKSTNGGVSWMSVHDFGEKVKHFEISRSNPDVMYLNTASGFYKTTDAGVNWTKLTMPAGVIHNKLEVALDFTNENIVWICSPNNTSGNRVFKTVNGGSTWTNLTTPTINGSGYRNLVHQAGTDGGVYIVTLNGLVFYRNNSMSDWASYSTGFPVGMDPLRSLAFYRDGKLRTGGSFGVWEIDFYEDSKPIAQPTVDKLLSDCPRDTFYFEDFSALKHTGASWTWSFSPAPLYVSSNNARNPKVVFGAIGTYDFTLTVSNAAGSDTKSVLGKIKINANACSTDTVPGQLLELKNPGDYAEAIKPLNISTNTITMSCWIKPTGTQVSNAGILFSGSNGASGLNFKSNNKLGYHWNGEAGSYNWNGGPTVAADVWSHVALVITPTSATVYLNGVAYTRTAAHIAVDFNSAFQLGIDRDNTARNYIGQMDEVCFYNRALSQNEIRELMNLTRNNPNPGSMPSTDASLIAYYQFNEGNGLPAYDKVGLNHVNIIGSTATKNTLSSAPVGGGCFERTTINTSGTFNFIKPGVELNFPTAGTYPNGDVVVTRLNVPSDQLCFPNTLPTPAGYFIIRNYGTNSTFTNLNSIKFNNIKGTTSIMTSTPNDLKLYVRSANDHGNLWVKTDSADVVTNNNGTGTVTFSTGLQLNTFGQFSIANQPVSITIGITPGNAPEEIVLSLVPNPSNNGWFTLSIQNNQTKHAEISIYNELGQLSKGFYLNEYELQHPVRFHIQKSGIYFVTVRTNNGNIVTKKVIVE